MSGEDRAEAYKIADKRYCKETIGPLPGDHDDGIRAAVDAAWPLAEAAGYRRAVQALRDQVAAFGDLDDWQLVAAGYTVAADYLETCAPRNEGAQT